MFTQRGMAGWNGLETTKLGLHVYTQTSTAADIFALVGHALRKSTLTAEYDHLRPSTHPASLCLSASFVGVAFGFYLNCSNP